MLTHFSFALEDFQENTSLDIFIPSVNEENFFVRGTVHLDSSRASSIIARLMGGTESTEEEEHYDESSLGEADDQALILQDEEEFPGTIETEERSLREAIREGLKCGQDSPDFRKAMKALEDQKYDASKELLGKSQEGGASASGLFRGTLRFASFVDAHVDAHESKTDSSVSIQEPEVPENLNNTPASSSHSENNEDANEDDSDNFGQRPPGSFCPNLPDPDNGQGDLGSVNFEQCSVTKNSERLPVLRSTSFKNFWQNKETSDSCSSKKEGCDRLSKTLALLSCMTWAREKMVQDLANKLLSLPIGLGLHSLRCSFVEVFKDPIILTYVVHNPVISSSALTIFSCCLQCYVLKRFILPRLVSSYIELKVSSSAFPYAIMKVLKILQG